jgi:hypothetical protein
LLRELGEIRQSLLNATQGLLRKLDEVCAENYAKSHAVGERLESLKLSRPTDFAVRESVRDTGAEMASGEIAGTGASGPKGGIGVRRNPVICNVRFAKRGRRKGQIRSGFESDPLSKTAAALAKVIQMGRGQAVTRRIGPRKEQSIKHLMTGIRCEG